MPRFDFHAFVASIGDRDHYAIIQAAEHEADRVEKACRHGKGAVANRKAGSTEYMAQLSRLLFWLRHSAFPAGMTVEDKVLYGDLAERLVASGQYGPTALDSFR